MRFCDIIMTKSEMEGAHINMKKALPYICAVLYSLIGGLLIQSLIYSLSIAISPFASEFDARKLYICGAIVIFCLIVLIALIIFNMNMFSVSEYAKDTIALEIVISAALLIPFWRVWSMVFEMIRAWI